MLLRKHNRTDTYRSMSLVLYGNLTFCIRTQPRHTAFMTKRGSIAHNRVRAHEGGGHKLRRLAARKTKHNPLIPCPLRSCKLLQSCTVHPLRNIRRLMMSHIKNSHGRCIKTDISAYISNVSGNITRNLGKINMRPRANFTSNQDKGRGGKSFARNTTVRILRKTGIKNSVRNLVAQLIRMTLTHRL